MIESYTGAVRGQNETKYDVLRAPRKNFLVFCLTSDYQYPVMNSNYSAIYGTLKDQTCTQSYNLKLSKL